ncbi:DNA repair protein RAD51 homolog 4 [Papilio machaon]|uniref:DNA repair protein RAD51 homolog 4 n=1 Tax=Papilio machaon TaxID=76193 RepID=UPI001E662FB9|nr:DNA repair protein RAD51 homolog 4 [Papilio machaon]
MEKLTSLDHVLMPKSVQRTLTINNITTILEFLQQDAERLSTLTKLNLSQILDIRNDIFTKFSAPVVDGPSLFALYKNKQRFVTTGIDSLNNVLGIGIPIGFITEICGLAGCGKTQLCLQLAINCAKQTENAILYIDTKGDFSAVRLQRILNNLHFTHEEMARILRKIKVVHIWTMEEILDLFKKLKDKSLTIHNLVLIIIDSLPCLLMQHFGDDNKIGLNYLNVLVNHCRFVCKNFGVGIVCVNIQTRWVQQDIADYEEEDDHVRETYVEKQTRGSGKYWQHIPAVVLQMEKIMNPDDVETYINNFPVKITLIRTNKMNLGQQCILNVGGAGVG